MVEAITATYVQQDADWTITVVHLLNGSALEFTSAYMTARLTLPKLPPLEVPPPGSVTQPQVPKQQTAEKKPAMPPSKQLPKAVQDRKKPATPPARESKAAPKKARA